MDWLLHISRINRLAALPAFISGMAIGFAGCLPDVRGQRRMAAAGATAGAMS